MNRRKTMRLNEEYKSYIDGCIKVKYNTNGDKSIFVEVSQKHKLADNHFPTAWIRDDRVKLVIFGNEKRSFVFDKEKLLKIAKHTEIKTYPSPDGEERRGFTLSAERAEELCLVCWGLE